MGTSGTMQSALSFEYRPSMAAQNTAIGMNGRRRLSASRASSAPVPPSTSARPTTPLTASVTTAAATKRPPASHAVPRSRVQRSTRITSSAPFRPCSMTLR